MYLQTKTTIEVPDEDEAQPEPVEETIDESAPSDVDDDEAVVEEVADEEVEAPKPKTKTVEVDKWSHVNPALPLWAR